MIILNYHYMSDFPLPPNIYLLVHSLSLFVYFLSCQFSILMRQTDECCSFLRRSMFSRKFLFPSWSFLCSKVFNVKPIIVRGFSKKSTKDRIDLNGVFVPVPTPFHENERQTLYYEKLGENISKWEKTALKGLLLRVMCVIFVNETVLLDV